MKKLFITGGGGYVGSYLISELLKESFRLKVLIYGQQTSQKIKSGSISYVNGNLCDANLITQAIAGCDAVVHLGAIVGSHILSENMNINYRGTKNIIESCKINSVNRLIFISSVSATRTAQGPYGKSKKMAEDLVKESGLNYTILRPTTIMGRESLGLNRIIKNVNRFNFFIPMVGLGYNTRHPVYIMDFIDIIIQSIKKDITIKKTYEVGGERVIYFRDLVKLINSKLGNRYKPIIPIPKYFVRFIAFFVERIYEIPPFTTEHVNALGENTRMDTNMLNHDLGFVPKPLNEVLDIVIGQIKKNQPDILG
tara:strand:+ start:2901 stop:3830 length:930 start_codon:yes stop_codon:yes gene_type:complete